MKHWDFLNNQNNLLQLKKRLRRYYRNETAYSITFEKWDSKYSSIILATKLLPGEINDIVNIVITLEKQFNIEKRKAIEQSILIWMVKHKEIKSYMDSWFEIGTINQRLKNMPVKKALKEQKARGFIHKDSVEFDPELPFIRSNAGPYVYPKQWKFKANVNMCGIYDKLPLIGVSGWTGITLPKRLYNK